LDKNDLNSNGGQLVRKYAARLHADIPDGLTVAIEAADMSVLAKMNLGEGVTLKSTQLEFKDLGIRDGLAIDYYCNMVREQGIENDSEALFKILRAIFVAEMQRPNLLCARVFTSLRSPNDAFAALRDMLGGRADNHVLFRIGESLLRNSEVISCPELCKFLNAMPNSVDLYEALLDRLRRDILLCRDVLETLKTQLTDASLRAYKCGLVALAEHDFGEAWKILSVEYSSQSTLHRVAAILAYGQIWQLAEQNKSSEDLETFLKDSIQIEDREISKAAREAISEAALHTEKFDDLLYSLASKGDSDMIREFVRILYQRGNLSEEDLNVRIPSVTAIIRSQKTYVGYLDALIAKLLQNEETFDAGFLCIDSWIKQGSLSEHRLGALPETIQTAFSKLLIGKVLTRWFFQKDVICAIVISKALEDPGQIEIDKPAFEVSYLPADYRNQIKEVTKRILCFLNKPEHQMSLLLSIGRADLSQKELKSLANLFYEEVLYEFPLLSNQAKQYIDEPNYPVNAKKAFAKVIAKIDAYVKKLLALPRLKELEPPSALVKAVQQRTSQRFHNAFKEAERYSVWKLIATTIPMKGGRKSFNYTMQGNVELKNSEEINVSAPIARSFVSDRVGLEFRRSFKIRENA